jgi:GNAT superfamily N-acetyltransferase
MPIAKPVPIKIEIVAQPSEADREPVLQKLLVYNEANGGPANYEPFAIRISDTTTGASVGGLWARIYYGWLYVDLIYVPEAARGRDIGSRLLAKAEAFARRQGCIGVWLNTFTFQAPGFYRKRGYRAFGTLSDYPKGQKLIFFRKSLDRVRPSRPKPASRRAKPGRPRRLP